MYKNGEESLPKKVVRWIPTENRERKREIETRPKHDNGNGKRESVEESVRWMSTENGERKREKERPCQNMGMGEVRDGCQLKMEKKDRDQSKSWEWEWDKRIC